MQLSPAMFRTLSVLIVFQLTTAATMAQQLAPHVDSPAASVRQLNGTWQPTSIKLNGYSLPREQLQTIRLQIMDGRFEFTAGETRETGTLAVAAGADGHPDQLNLDYESGPSQGTSLRGIYRLDKGKLTVCYSLDGKRPAVFASSLESETMLLEYGRLDE